ncbi:MAG: patatin-like phospholipase family protein [Candidatus Aminicenantia bacterium]
MRKYKIGLALSGGAVLGFAHIGVIKILQERGIEISCVSGTSVGSLVGAFLASGYDWWKMWEIARNLSWKDLGKLVLPKRGLLDGSNIKKFIERNLGKKNISELKIPYCAIAVDIKSGEEIVFREGDLGLAVQASCSIPGIFTPVEWKGRKLLDGGLKNLAPVEECRGLGCDYVIAVKLLPGLEKREANNIFQILLTTHDMIVRKIAESSPKGDVDIVPDLSNLNSYDFSQAEELFRRGEEAARNAFPKIMKILNPSFWKAIKRKLQLS